MYVTYPSTVVVTWQTVRTWSLRPLWGQAVQRLKWCLLFFLLIIFNMNFYYFSSWWSSLLMMVSLWCPAVPRWRFWSYILEKSHASHKRNIGIDFHQFLWYVKFFLFCFIMASQNCCDKNWSMNGPSHSSLSFSKLT